jgi:hypothetical protein
MSKHEPFYYFKRLRDATAKRTACNVGLAENELSLRYHDTVVARYYFDSETLILEHGSWVTKMTKERINLFCDVLDLPVYVSQSKKVWYVHSPESCKEWSHVSTGYPCELAVEGVSP